MARIYLAILAGLLCITASHAQLSVGPTGPFVRRLLSARYPVLFKALVSDPNLEVLNYNFQIYARYGSTVRILHQQNGTDWQTAVDLLNLPLDPEPQFLTVVTVRHRNSGTQYTLSRTFPIRFTDPYQLVEVDLVKFNLLYDLKKAIVGRKEVHLYALDNQPPKTRSVMMSLVNADGDTVAWNRSVGNPYLDTAALLGYGTFKHQGALRLRAQIMYDDGPENGYFTERSVPDSVPVPDVIASEGFGPFAYGRDRINRFIVKDLGPSCTQVEWGLRYTTATNRRRTPVWITRPYNGEQDSMHFVYNMRDVSRGSELIVRAHYGPNLPVTERRYQLDITPRPPVFASSSPFPFQLGTNKQDTITIDSLPPRVQRLQMQLVSSSGVVLKSATFTSKGPGSADYVRSGKLIVFIAPLRTGTYFVRALCTNDMRDNDPVDVLTFEVRDTTTYYLTSASWGPFTQGDTAVVAPAVTNIRPYSGGDGWTRIGGKFVVVDTTNASTILFESPFIDLSGVKSRDSVICWPDTSYRFKQPIRGRVEIPTVNLPLTTVVQFVRQIDYNGRIQNDRTVDHPIIMVPAPGELVTSPHLDSTFVVTRNQPITLRLRKILPQATAVRFALSGTNDPDAVVEKVVTRSAGQDSVEWTTDAGVLPVNAKASVSAVTPYVQDEGAEVVRSINTAPDTLSMTSAIPFDVLRLDWNVDPATQLIRGVKPFQNTLTFSRIPAQTRQIELLVHDDRDTIIDSVALDVPYRLGYDSTLRVVSPFAFSAFNIAALEVRYVSDGGPVDGIRYRRAITSQQQPFSLTLKSLDATTAPPTYVNRPLRQGSSDIAELTLRWTSGKGLASTVTIDSIVMDVLDCAGNVIDRELLPVPAQLSSTGIVTQALYAVSKLPLSTDAVRMTVYSERMTLPRTGVATTIPLKLRTNPLLHVPLGLTYPTYRVNDTTSFALRQRMVATNVNSITEIDSLQIVDASSRVVKTFAAARPNRDTIRFAEYDFNALRPEDGPFFIRGLVRTSTCVQLPAILDTLALIEVTPVMDAPRERNWVFSSQGWGPFQQGRAPTTNIVASISPSWFITSRSEVADSLAISIVGWSKEFGIFTPDVPQGFTYTARSPLPASVRVRRSLDLSPFDTASAVGIRVQRFARSLTGTTKEFEQLYTFPVAMREFPDQRIIADTTGYEQSVLAGTSSTDVMKSIYDFRMEPQSAAIDSLRFVMMSSDETVLDGLAVGTQSRNVVDSTSVFTMQRNVASYPWPHVARDRARVAINVGYQFAGATKPTKIQKTAITILPRADWLNGTTVRLTGAPTDSLIDIAVDIPMPFCAVSDNLPLFGRVSAKLVSSDTAGGLTVAARYNKGSRGFSILDRSQTETFWKPTISIADGGNFNISNTVNDGSMFDEFTALYRFVDAPLADNSAIIPNRELRVRQLYTAGGGGPVGMVRWIKEMGGIIKKLAKATSIVSLTPTFVLDLSARQVSTVNLGTEETGTLVHLSEEEPPTIETEPNEFPTSQGMSWIITGGGGIDASLMGVFGINASITHNMIVAYGNTYSGGVKSRKERYWPAGRIHENWFNLEMSLFFGLINIDLFRGRLNSWLQDDDAMPSYLVFSSSWESLFKGGIPEPPVEIPTRVQPLAGLPQELPFYNPAPAIASDTNNLLAVHIEQALLDNTGRLVLSTLNNKTRGLESSVTVMQNRNGMHNATLALVGKQGNAAVAWTQNALDSRYYGSSNLNDLLGYEEVHAAMYDATTNAVQQLGRISEPAQFTGTPRIAVANDSSTAMVIWQTIRLTESPLPGQPPVYMSDIRVRPIIRTARGWQLGESKIVWSRSNARDVNITSLPNGSYLIACMYDESTTQPETVSYWEVSATSTKPWERMGTVDEAEMGTVKSDIELMSNGNDVVLIYGHAHSTDSARYVRSLNYHRYANGAWKKMGSPSLGASTGLFRHIKGDVSNGGTLFTLIDAYDYDKTDSTRHKVITIVGSIHTPPDSWKVFSNHEVYSEGDRSIWSADASVGYDDVLYLVTQELDTVRGNRQKYRNGVPLGASRLNTVLRAMRLTQSGDLVGSSFGGTPTSVERDRHEDLEASLRYRVRLMDPSPNPTHGTCTVPVSVLRACTINVRLVDAVGRTVETLYAGPVGEGIQGITFNATAIPAGAYHVVISDHIGLAGSVPLVVMP